MNHPNHFLRSGMSVLFIVSLLGCSRFNERIDEVSSRVDDIENAQINSLKQQIAAMGESVTKLEKTDTELKAYIETLQSTATELRKSISENDSKITELEKSLDQAVKDAQNSDSALKSELEQQITTAKSDVLDQLAAVKSAMESRLEQTEATIAELQSKDAELEKKISELKTYVDNGIDSAKDWASATFTTLEQYNSIVSDISGIKGSIESLGKSVSDLETNLSETVQSEVTKAMEPVKDQMISDAAAAVVANYTETISSIRNEMEKLTSRVKKLEDDVKLIKEDIDQIKKDIEEITGKLGSQDFSGIRSIVFIPYSDGKAYMYRTKEGTSQAEGETTLRFEVQPAEMAEKLARTWETSLKIKAFYSTLTGSTGESVDLPIKSVVADNGVLAVTMSGENMGDAFYANEILASVRLFVGSDGAEIKSEYVPIIPLVGKINIPDIYLKSYLTANYDDNKDCEISEDEALKVKKIDVSSSSYSVRTLSGIEYFTNLERLDCSGNRITDIDLSYATGLQYLNCSDNAIAELSLSENHSIATLSCFGNPISKLDIDGCKNLKELYLYANGDNLVSDNSISICKYGQSQTFELSASNTPFVKFSFTDAPEVTALSLSGDFTDVDISGNKTLQVVDVTHNPKLKVFNCSNNDIGQIDVKNNTLLEELNISGNKSLTSVDVSSLPALSVLNVLGCSLKSVDVSDNTKLKMLDCSNNDIGQIVFNNALLEELNVSENKSLTSVDISSLSNLSVLDISDCSLKSIDVTKNTGLISFKCPGNDLSSVNVRRNSSLRVFDISNNKNMSAIDVWNNVELRELYASSLSFSELDLTENKKLKVLDVSNNSKLAEVVFSSPENLYGVFAKNDASIKFMDSDGQTLYWGSEINIDGKIWSGYSAGVIYDKYNDIFSIHGKGFTFDTAVKACPDGWRLPTKEELESLSAHYSSVVTPHKIYRGRWFSGSKEYSTSVPAIFLPGPLSSSPAGYWSSTVYDSDKAYILSFGVSSKSPYNDVDVTLGSLSDFYKVRCIKN